MVRPKSLIGCRLFLCASLQKAAEVLGEGSLPSVLSITHERYIDMYFAKKSGKTTAEIAEDFDCSIRTVDSALKWCRSRRVGQRERIAELEKRIRDAGDDVRRLEGDIDRVRKHITKQRVAPAGESAYIALNNSLIGFHRELREQKKHLAELQGIYRETVRVEHTGEDGKPIQYEVVDPDADPDQ